ncbi:MAG: DUF4446 family protein [Actinomycetota bacterium]|nr:DUF4446 family protein [Actinomycetota bacterium]
MHLDPRTLSALVVGAVAIALASVLLTVSLSRRLARLRVEVAALRADPALVAGVDPKAVRNVAVVRYDAFESMAGRMSYSVALLDAAGDGLVLSAINGRADARTYAKGILAGECNQQLSPEEQQAVAAALGRAPSRARR